MELRPGTRLRSVVCTTEVVVVRPAHGELACGGQPMVPLEGVTASADANLGHEGAPADGTLLGKRYADPASGLEVLCTKAGKGSLTLDDTPLRPKDAKPLPSSD